MDIDSYGRPPIQDKYAELERSLIEEFLRMNGHDFQSVLTLTEEQRIALLSHASEFAAGKLAEVEARAHYVHDIHGARKD